MGIPQADSRKAFAVARPFPFSCGRPAFRPVGYQILEGLQPGTNLTWSLLAQQKITKYLDLNLNYFGRKTETSNTIHTGTVQLKAYF